MDKAYKVIGILKWACFLLGAVMWYFTRDSFGSIIAICLGVAATVSFWLLMRREETRLIGQNIAMSIREAINETAQIESFIEIKKMKGGIIARVYLINAREMAATVQRAIKNKIDGSIFKKYILVMQMTDMASKDDLASTQRFLNDQLLRQLVGSDDKPDLKAEVKKTDNDEIKDRKES